MFQDAYLFFHPRDKLKIRTYDLGSQHPDPNNPGTGEDFRLQIPFEVWDMEAEGGEQQIDIAIYDRLQSYSSGDTVYSFKFRYRA